MEIKEIREKARKLIVSNFFATGGSHISLSYPHYRDHHGWESEVCAISASELGLNDLAVREVLLLIQSQRPEGWIPCITEISKREGLNSLKAIGLTDFNKKESRNHSAYSAPILLATALDWINDSELTKQILPSLINYYDYFLKYRDPDKDNLPSLIHPHETVQDASPNWDPLLRNIFIPWMGKFNLYLHYWSRVKLNWRCRLEADWDPQRILAKHIFDVEDVQFITIFIQELRTMAKLSPRPESAQYFNQTAERMKNALLELCWDRNDKFFYCLDWENRKIKSRSISGLFPLLLSDLPKEMVNALIEHLTDKKEFWTPYLIPTISQKNSRFNPTDRHGLLRGACWIHWNWHVVTGLIRHGHLDLAQKIIDNDIKKIILNEEKQGTGFWENYHPFNGLGIRQDSKNFTPSALIVTYPSLISKESGSK